MHNIITIVQNHFLFFYASGLAWVSLWMAASVIYRKSRGKPLFPRRPIDTVFSESWASGHSNRNLWTKLGGASRCLRVFVTRDTVFVSPFFPFNLMFLPEVYDLEYCIPIQRIRSAEQNKRWLVKTVRIEFSNVAGELRSVELRLKNPVAFLQALGRV